MRSFKLKLVVFVGPQGSGKTTQAHLLRKAMNTIGRKRVRVCLTESIHYTLVARLWYKLIMIISQRKIRYRFHLNGPVQEFVEPAILERLSALDLLVHITSALISLLKVRVLSLYYDVVIEHEGFVLNQVAYIAFIHRRHTSLLSVMKKLRILLVLLPRGTITIIFRADHKQLEERYIRRTSYIEPSYYIGFQSSVYDEVVRWLPGYVVRVDTSRNVKSVFQDLWKAVLNVM